MNHIPTISPHSISSDSLYFWQDSATGDTVGRRPCRRWALVRAATSARMIRVLLWLGVFFASSWMRAAAADDSVVSAEQRTFFETHIRPLLVRKCQGCHGARKQEGDLRLDSREGVLKGGESGPAAVPGRADESLLLEAVRYESFEMPPEHPLDKAEITALERWIEAGLPWPKVDPAKLRSKSIPAFTPTERGYWAFQPIRAYPIPTVSRPSWCNNPIDAFVLAKLEQHGLAPAPAADRRTLIRRAYFDTIGLPPSSEEIEAFVNDPADDDTAYARLVDRLLASPHFGERMARHWLDLVRFAESDGYRADAFRESAWRYRDYVVRSFNQDKPYDRFVAEQLAGDEIAPDDPDVRVATTFLRLGVYESNQRDARFHWTLIIDEMTDVIGETFLGLSMACARCHDHKFDPILRRDYYRLRAYFAPLLWDDSVPAATAEQVESYRRDYAKWSRATAELRSRLAGIEDPILRSLKEAQVAQFPEDIQAIYAKPVSERDWLEQQLAYLVHRQVLDRYKELSKKLTGSQKKEWEALRGKIEEGRPKELPVIMAVRDAVGASSSTVIPGTDDSVLPGPLSILDPQPAPIATPPAAPHSTGRRLALARWLTDPENPLPARVIVNRIWQAYFDRGIVETPSEFGKMGSPPTHPRLLDYLAWNLVRTDEPWKLKSLHRMILLSATYRQSSFHPRADQQERVDPENRLRWRAPTKRLDAEQLRDLMLAASGKLDRTVGGNSVSGKVPRRSIYVRRMRNTPDGLLRVFDAPAGFVSTARRDRTTTPLQTLLMWNSAQVQQTARAIAGRILREGHATESDQIERACELILQRAASSKWQERAERYLAASRSESEAESGKRESDAALRALSDICHVLLNSNACVYLD